MSDRTKQMAQALIGMNTRLNEWNLSQPAYQTFVALISTNKWMSRAVLSKITNLTPWGRVFDALEESGLIASQSTRSALTGHIRAEYRATHYAFDVFTYITEGGFRPSRHEMTTPTE